MSKFSRFDVWYANFPFENEPKSKDRPVLIININGEFRVSALMITSADVRDEHDMVIEEWREAGLVHASVIRTRRQYNLDVSRFRRKIGTLQPTDRLRLMMKQAES